jgi:hypothetical protein
MLHSVTLGAVGAVGAADAVRAARTACALLLLAAGGLCIGCGDALPPGVDAKGPLLCPVGATLKESEIPIARGGGHQERCTNPAGQRHGPARGWFADGQIRYYTEWWEGKKHGRFALWWSNGQLKAEGAHRDWQPEGLWTNWDENGEITSQHDYATGPYPYPIAVEGQAEVP